MRKIAPLALLVFFNTSLLLAQKTILWEIKNPASSKVSYLLGSFHQMGNSFIDEKPIIKELLLKSDIAVFESIEDKTEKVVSVMKARPDDFSYRAALDSPDVAFIDSYTTQWLVPVSKQKPSEFLVKLQQSYVAQNCGVIKVTDSFRHMDDYLETVARSHNIELLGLETYADQITAINSNKGEEALTWDKAKAGVHFWVENFQSDKKRRDICATAKEYLKMKFDYQFDVTCANNDLMVSARNEKWIPILIENIASHNAFITVGLFHLYGACGLITQLRNRGYEVNPVYVK